ncbi:hypothetical protein E2I00_019261, partial [Balaenoptera physalus]
IVLEVVRTVESILGERTSQFSYNTTSLAWRQQGEVFVFEDEDGPVPHSVTVLVFSPDSALFLATICEDGSVAVPDLAFYRSHKNPVEKYYLVVAQLLLLYPGELRLAGYPLCCAYRAFPTPWLQI